MLTTPPPPPPLGSLVPSKKRILNGRNNSSAPDTQLTNSSAILDQGSTSNDRDLKPYWNGQVAEWSRKLWLPIVTDSAASTSPSILQNSWFSSTIRPPTSTNFPRISLQPTLSSSVECKEKELLYIDESVKTGEISKKRKASATRARTKRQRSEGTLNRTLLVKAYPNHPQKQLLKRWMGLARFAYNSVIKWSKRCYFTEEDGVKKKRYINPMTRQQKLLLFNDIRAGINVDEVNDKKLINSAIWGERKFMRAVVRLGMLLRGTLNVAPANIIDEAIDEALIARSEVIKRNTKRAQGEPINSLSFRAYKDLRQTITIRAQNFSSSTWDRFYITYLHTPSMYTSHRYKPTTILSGNQRALYPLHFEKKRKNNKWPIPHKVSCDSKLTYFRQTNEWKLAWVYETQKQLRETQADSSIHAVSIDPGVRTPFTWYSPTKGVGKIGEHDISQIVRLCMYMDNLISKKDQLIISTSKRKKKKAKRINNAIFRMRRKIIHLQNEIHRKAVAFFTHEFDAIIIPPFEVSGMINRKKRKITKKTVRKMLGWAHYRFRQRLVAKAEELGVHIIIQNEAYTSKTCSWCGKIQKIGGSEVYNCRNCRTVIDRDENGARGIFLRALLDGALILSGDHAGNSSFT